MAGHVYRGHTYFRWGDKEGDDITRLPQGWEARVADDSRVFFLDHKEEKTQWSHPVTGIRFKVSPGLPYGWQRFKDSEDSVVFVDHLNQIASYVDPRLLSAPAVEMSSQYGIRHFTSIKNHFPSLVRSEQVLKDVDLWGKVAIVTGANSGLGYQVSQSLATSGAHVVLACRDPEKARVAVTSIKRAKPDAKVESMLLDLSSLRSVKSFCEEFAQKNLPLHILVCNAGTFGGPFSLTVDGLETHFAVNHLGHFYLTQLLMDVLLASKPSRVVVVSSESHWYPSPDSEKLNLSVLQHPHTHLGSYSPILAYGASKLCNILFALELHRRFAEKGVHCNCVHPGNLLPTNLTREAGLFYKGLFTCARFFTKSLSQAASTILYCAAHPSMDNVSGLYMYECWPVEPSEEAQDPHTASALWDLSQHIIADKTSAFYASQP